MSRSTTPPNSRDPFSELTGNILQLVKKLQDQNFFSEDLSLFMNQPNVSDKIGKEFLEEIMMPMFQDYISLFNKVIQTSISPSSGKKSEKIEDKRFSNELWTIHPFFEFLAKSHLILENYTEKAIDLSRINAKNKKAINQLHYLLEQVMGAISPSNYLFTNPVLLQEVILTHGDSLIKGLQNLERDLSKDPNHLLIPMVNREHYILGENIATTPGKVIFQNDLIQLIQYEPQTKTVHETPLLFVSAIINKFYILDLNAQSSLIEWMVKKGYTVFSISWVNPDASFSNKEISDYVLDGPIAAIEVIKKITGMPKINIAGYCIGGTLVACALAYLSAKNDDSIKSVTYLTTMLDFQNFGFFTDFIDEDYIKKTEKIMKKQGYLDGYLLHQIFNFLRPNDLVWPYYIKNYLQGQSPGENDLLFWNSDYTNIPPKVMRYCLKNFVINNDLIKPKKLSINNTKIDLHSIKLPAYFFSTIRDHLTPWKSTYAGLPLHSGKTTFVLGDSGHIVGVVNPPTKKKYGYFINTETHNTPEEFLENAKKLEGSWWPHWEKWLKSYSGKKVEARKPGSKQFPPLENAPGSYVKIQYTLTKQKKSAPKKKKSPHSKK